MGGVLDVALVEEEAVGGGERNAARKQGQMAKKAGDRSSTLLGAGDADDGMRPVCPSGKQVADDGLARLRLADGGFEMHEQAGSGIDFDDGAALVEQGLRYPRPPMMPAMSRPTMRAARAARAALSGWTRSVTSKAWLVALDQHFPCRWADGIPQALADSSMTAAIEADER